ncbi:MAG: AI-2E family transporter [Desulfatibacillaceae bacterium]|nr:AI-2E family transporter [Desulfatibacillaceae bacterium]
MPVKKGVGPGGSMIRHRNHAWLVFGFFLALFFLSLGLLGWLIKPFISVLVIAFVVTGVFSPLFKGLKKKMPAKAAALLTCVLVFFVLFIPIVLFVGLLSNEAYELYTLARDRAFDQQIRELLVTSSILERTTAFSERYGIHFSTEDINRALQDTGRVVGGFLWSQANAIAGNILRFVLYFFFMLLVTYFFLLDGSKFADYAVDLSPLPEEQDRRIIQKFKDMSGAILIGNGFCGLLQGVAGGVAFWILNIGSPLLWGAVMAILAFLPIVGISAIMVPASVILFVQGRVAAALGLFIFFALLSSFAEYILKPRLVGGRMQMHPLLVFLAIVGGLQIFGIIGVIYGPLVVTLFLTLAEIYKANYRNIVVPEIEDGQGAEEKP